MQRMNHATAKLIQALMNVSSSFLTKSRCLCKLFLCTNMLLFLQDKAFADGGLDPISDDSDDDVPLGQRRTKVIA